MRWMSPTLSASWLRLIWSPGSRSWLAWGRLRPSRSLMVHQRIGAPLRRVEGRLATAPAWTVIEVARGLRRPRALATLDAGLHVGACTTGELRAATREQKGRRGVVKVRELIECADGRAESP